MAGGRGTKEISNRYPCVTGIEADSKHEGRKINLIPTEGSNIPKREKAGME
jgi:hypothetical protein